MVSPEKQRDDVIAIKLVLDEVQGIRRKFTPHNSAHEAYAVLLEEVEEFWEEVKKKKHLRDTRNMAKELVQISAVATKALVDLGLLPFAIEKDSPLVRCWTRGTTVCLEDLINEVIGETKPSPTQS